MRVYAIYCAIGCPNSQIYLFRRTYGDLAANHLIGAGGFMEMLQPLVDSGECKILSSTMKIEFKNGSIIHLCHLQRADDKWNYLGREMSVLLIDEATLFDYDSIRFLRSRVRVQKDSIPEHMRPYIPRIIMGSNPGNIGHDALKQAFIDAAPHGTVFTAPEDDGGFTRMFLPAKLEDNPSLDYEEYSKALKGLGDPELVEAMLTGSWDILTDSYFGSVYHKKTHVLEPFTLPEGTTVERGYDYGQSKPYSVLYIATLNSNLEHGGRFFAKGTKICIHEIYGGVKGKHKGLEQTSEEQAVRIKEFEACDDFKRILGNNKVVAGMADAAIFHAINGNCIYDGFKRNGIEFIPSSKEGGSIAVGLSKIKSMMAVAKDDGRILEEPALYFFNTCWNLINIIGTISRDPRNPEIVLNSANVNDHALDTLRYAIHRKDTKITISNFSF